MQFYKLPLDSTTCQYWTMCLFKVFFADHFLRIQNDFFHKPTFSREKSSIFSTTYCEQFMKISWKWRCISRNVWKENWISNNKPWVNVWGSTSIESKNCKLRKCMFTFLLSNSVFPMFFPFDSRNTKKLKCWVFINNKRILKPNYFKKQQKLVLTFPYLR